MAGLYDNSMCQLLESCQIAFKVAHSQSSFPWNPLTSDVRLSVSSEQGRKGKLPVALDAVASCRDGSLGERQVLLISVFLAHSLETVSILWLLFEQLQDVTG